VKKSFSLSVVVLLGFASLCLHGCGEGAPKADESMESTFKQAKKDNPNAVPPAGKSSAIKPGDKQPPAATNNEAANNGA
jgi:hypothetical protein